MAEEPITHQVHYEFRLADGTTREFAVKLRVPDLRLIPSDSVALPAWTRLGEGQCTHCPLKVSTHPHCPVAANLVEVIDVFKDCLSHAEAEVTIRSEARAFHKRVALQSGLSSLMGLIMVTSGCPILDKLRPMVITHLPFATLDETLFRALGAYLLAQHFRRCRGLSPDWELADFAAVYDAVAQLNRCFRERLARVEMRDANFNALVHLDCFAVFGAMSVEGDGLAGLEPVFRAYLDTNPPG